MKKVKAVHVNGEKLNISQMTKIKGGVDSGAGNISLPGLSDPRRQ